MSGVGHVNFSDNQGSTLVKIDKSVAFQNGEIMLNLAKSPRVLRGRIESMIKKGLIKVNGDVNEALDMVATIAKDAKAEGEKSISLSDCIDYKIPNEKKLGKNVVVIGGGDIGTETGMFLANAGHRVTVLTSGRELMERGGPHVKEIQIDLYQRMDNFSYITQATNTRISNGMVTYTDVKGKEKYIQADSLVIYAGLRPRQDEAMKFSGSAKRFLILGDCTGKCGNVQKTIRSAFFAASQV